MCTGARMCLIVPVTPPCVYTPVQIWTVSSNYVSLGIHLEITDHIWFSGCALRVVCFAAAFGIVPGCIWDYARAVVPNVSLITGSRHDLHNIA